MPIATKSVRMTPVCIPQIRLTRTMISNTMSIQFTARSHHLQADPVSILRTRLRPPNLERAPFSDFLARLPQTRPVIQYAPTCGTCPNLLGAHFSDVIPPSTVIPAKAGIHSAAPPPIPIPRNRPVNRDSLRLARIMPPHPYPGFRSPRASALLIGIALLLLIAVAGGRDARIHATSSPSLSAALTETGVALTLSNHSSNWWYEILGDGCWQTVSGQTVNVSGYLSGSYSATAYGSSSDCDNEENSLAETAFGSGPAPGSVGVGQRRGDCPNHLRLPS